VGVHIAVLLLHVQGSGVGALQHNVACEVLHLYQAGYYVCEILDTVNDTLAAMKSP
jgi:hypothetical protein